MIEKTAPVLCLSLCCLLVSHTVAQGINHVVFVILSQNEPYHLRLAVNLKRNLEDEAKQIGMIPSIVHLSHSDFSKIGHWAILPLIPTLQKLHLKNSTWIFFSDDITVIRLKNLLMTLARYDSSKEIYVGYTLNDEEPTIIHHFAPFGDTKSFKYPNIASGFAMTTKLLKSLGNRLAKDVLNSDFTIDRSHELSKYIYNDGKGHRLIHDNTFCIEDKATCSALPMPFKDCQSPLEVKNLYFAVKTCSKFHQDRIPVVLKTWARQAQKIDFFSDLKDASIPTISLGVPNAESGHCAKTMAILKFVVEKLKEDDDVQWIILADDDTLLSVERLRRFLTCYDSDGSIALGERYGYNVLTDEGYDYITGGGGIVLSRRLVETLTKDGVCVCPQSSTPDDMYLGICIGRIGGRIVHSPYFHQARPEDYSKDYLKWQMLISFHKHWMNDPYEVYEKWLASDDKIVSSDTHIEL